ncbi:LytTR family DNA-binding domain-containing protein [Clostridium sp. HCP1S3_B4]|uniref:LytTR family DNA-binding domain-containing protein n=1 Tax=unclassified Clostridium TaxID=2614128 RepID=UPI0016B02A65|nr:LytTR family DNA-binding domain-containing protein [Clostridiales bacterium]MDY2728704.1 LytTR family DNA-binding domain-containing protein [Clostridium sp.]NLK24039.1 LytTR family transcriptional regulator [Clostridiales bacterium]
MKLDIKLSKDVKEAYAVIYTDKITAEITRIASLIENNTQSVITVKKDEKYIVIEPKNIFMIRVEDKQVTIYDKNCKYRSSKRLYELEKILGNDFIRISKSTIINLKEIDSVEPCFNGIMYIKLKNGTIDYISRKYLPNLKKYLGL